MAQFNTVRIQINEMTSDSGYKGVNLLGGASVSLTVKFDESGQSQLTINGFNATSSTGGLLLSNASWLNGGATAVSSTGINEAITTLDAAKNKLRTESSNRPTT
jgi:hypothetical protein